MAPQGVWLPQPVVDFAMQEEDTLIPSTRQHLAFTALVGENP